jgi:hypothetical protein
MFYYCILGLLLVCMAALVTPVSLSSVEYLEIYFSAILILAAMALVPWVYRQVRLSPQLSVKLRARTPVYLLSGYIAIFGIYLSWPCAFSSILVARISSKVNWVELEKDQQSLLEEMWAPAPPITSPPVDSAMRRMIARKYQITSLDGTPISVAELIVTLNSLNKIRSGGPFLSAEYLLIFFQSILVAAILLNGVHATNAKSILAAIIVVFMIVVAVIFYVPEHHESEYSSAVYVLLFIFSLATMIIGKKARSNRLLNFVSVHIFTLLLAWVPVFLFSFLGLLHGSNTSLYLALFTAGIIILFLFLPRIQRHCSILQAKPI